MRMPPLYAQPSRTPCLAWSSTRAGQARGEERVQNVERVKTEYVMGTPYEIETKGRILFIEDVGEEPYRIDRMLTQLKLAGKLTGVRGIVFGEMRDCIQTANLQTVNQGYALEEIVARIVGELGVPVAYGVPSGHVTAGNITLPFGVRAGLEVRGGQVSLRMLEAAVTAVPGQRQDSREKTS